MKIKQKIFMFMALAGLMLSSLVFYSPAVFAEDCGEYSTSVLPCNTSCSDGSAVGADGKCKDGTEPNSIWTILRLVVSILTGGIAIAAVGGVIYASVLYSSAGGSSDNIKKAKAMFINIIIGVIAYALIYAFLNYIIPGGVRL